MQVSFAAGRRYDNHRIRPATTGFLRRQQFESSPRDPFTNELNQLLKTPVVSAKKLGFPSKAAFMQVVRRLQLAHLTNTKPDLFVIRSFAPMAQNFMIEPYLASEASKLN